MTRKIPLVYVFIFLCTFSQSDAGHPNPLPAEVGVSVNEAWHLLWEAIKTHPKKEVHTDLQQAIITKRLHVVYSREPGPSPLWMGYEKIGVEQVLTLGIAIPWMLHPNKYIESSVHDSKLRWIALYHEAKHHEHHQKGKRIITQDEVRLMSPCSVAQYVWDVEWYATRADWDFAKEIGAEDFRVYFRHLIKWLGEEEGFLRAFHITLLTENPIISPSPERRVCWDQIFQRELSTIKKRKW